MSCRLKSRKVLHIWCTQKPKVRNTIRKTRYIKYSQKKKVYIFLLYCKNTIIVGEIVLVTCILTDSALKYFSGTIILTSIPDPAFYAPTKGFLFSYIFNTITSFGTPFITMFMK